MQAKDTINVCVNHIIQHFSNLLIFLLLLLKKKKIWWSLPWF